MICHVTLNTANIEETVEFYSWLLDLPIDRRIKTPMGEIVFLGDNETKLELIEDSEAEIIDASGISIGFSVDDLDEKIIMLDNKKIKHTSIISPMPSVRFIFLFDPTGCKIQLFESKH